MPPSKTIVRRWTGFVSAICLMQLSGTYGFSNYSTALKEVLGLTQVQLNRLSVAKDLGDSFGILAGILSNYLPTWSLLCIGASVGILGYGIQWLVVSQIISPLPYWMMFIAALLAGNSVSWMNVATFTVSVRNFSRNRGPVVGLFKAYMGLSAAIYSRMCDYLFSSSSSKYLLMLVLVPPSFCIISAIFIRPVPPAETEEEEQEEKRSIFIFNSIACILAVYITIINIVPSDGIAAVVASGLMIIVAAPIFVPLYIFSRMKSVSGQYAAAEDQIDGDEKASLEKLHAESDDPDIDSLRQPLLKISSDLKTFSSGHKRCGCLAPLPELGEDRNTLLLFTSWDFYALYIALFCGAGSGMMFSNNLGQIGQSFGFTSVTILTSFFSLGNFCGRIASGNGSEYFLRIVALPRPVMIGLAKVPMIAMFIWLSTGTKVSLYVGAVVVGFCHGTFITLTIPTVSEFYGLKDFGTNFMVANTHLLAGSSVFSGLLAGYLYDVQAQKEQGIGVAMHSMQQYLFSEESLTCYGSSCYGETLLILAGVMGAALALDALLAWFSRPLYKKLQRINAHIFVHEKPTSHTIK